LLNPGVLQEVTTILRQVFFEKEVTPGFR